MRDGQFRSAKRCRRRRTRDLVGQDPIGIGSSGKRACINLLLPSQKGSESTGSSLADRGLCALVSPFFVQPFDRPKRFVFRGYVSIGTVISSVRTGFFSFRKWPFCVPSVKNDPENFIFSFHLGEIIANRERPVGPLRNRCAKIAPEMNGRAKQNQGNNDDAQVRGPRTGCRMMMNSSKNL